jgi:endogenous inhibitor of DNA gyrase (YacG/DUF329 family)
VQWINAHEVTFKTDDIFEIDCPECGSGVEFFKEETKRKCQNCGKMVVNPKLE